MQPADRCLHVCLLGDPGCGQTAFLRSYCGGGEVALAKEGAVKTEPFVVQVELDGEPCCVRFTDSAGSPVFDAFRSSVLSSAHVVLLCFAVDDPDTLTHVQDRWLPHLWATGSEAPFLLVGLRSDRRSGQCVHVERGLDFAKRKGALCYLECSAVHPETTRRVMDEALGAAKEYYGLQWQLQPDPEFTETTRPSGGSSSRMGALTSMSSPPHSSYAGDGAPWLQHENLNVPDDPRALEQETVRRNLSVLGLTPERTHAYLRVDLAEMALTSIDALRGDAILNERPFDNLQFVNVSRNHLRTLEPLGALRHLLHLNASFNLLVRTQSFTAPDALETVDMSYNMIGELGEWGVHKFLRELNLRGNFISAIGPGLMRNFELRMLDLSENHLARIENLDGLGLRSVYLAQNRLTSLEGVSSLSKLQALNVRHNNITSIGALRAEDVSRLRKLIISENRISHIDEVGGLESFPFLCDLVLAPNPVIDLPYYRSQVLHRLPRLRSLDAQSVPAEEKVKADLIYGSDVELRREIFEQLLPEETFVDRRLVTEEEIQAMEVEQFGRQGDAGPFGLPRESEAELAGYPVQRSRLQEAKLQQRLEQARLGGEPAGVADFANFAAPFVSVVVGDSDLPAILEAVAEGNISELLLGAARLSPNGVREVIMALRESPTLRFVDLAGCGSVAQVGELRESAGGFPAERGCSLETTGCGLSEREEEYLRNRTPEAEEALLRAQAERDRTAQLCTQYLARQEALEDYASENCTGDLAPSAPPHLCHPSKWREGVERPAQGSYSDFRAANPSGLRSSGYGDRRWMMKLRDGTALEMVDDQYFALCKQRDAMLVEWGCLIESQDEGEYEGEDVPSGGGNAVMSDGGRPLPEAFEEAFRPVRENNALVGFMLWEGVQPNGEMVEFLRREREEWQAAWHTKQQRCLELTEAAAKIHDTGMVPGVASGQLIAHFSYLCSGGELRGGEQPKACSQFGLKRLSDSPRPPPMHGQDLHEALNAGLISIEVASGSSFGAEALTLKLRSSASEDLEIAVRRGSIFQHVDWQHRQNLLVSIEYVVTVPAGGCVLKQLHAYCMNFSCACSNGNPMNLTELYLDDQAVLESQGLVWDHFEACFGQK